MIEARKPSDGGIHTLYMILTMLGFKLMMITFTMTDFRIVIAPVDDKFIVNW